MPESLSGSSDHHESNNIMTSKSANNLRKHSSFEKRPPVFLIFADLDGTFTPMDIEGKIDFLSVIREIQEKEGVMVKFIPVSGRPAGYVLRLLHEVRDMLSGMDIHGVCDYGAAEQGAVIVDSKRSYGPHYMGDPDHVNLKAQIAEIIANNEHHEIISDEPDKLYTCSIHIKNEAKEHMTHEQQFEVYNSVKKQVLEKFGEGVLNISMSHNCMEVMHKEISKSEAMHTLIRNYAADFNVVGFLYAGDAENDKIAMEFVSKYAELRGINAHNFVPGNAQDAILSHKLEPWKHRNRKTSTHFVEKLTLLIN
jgi:hydroxymethylpyrimidine pyrophosphatase-like HAD family hydrolase